MTGRVCDMNQGLSVERAAGCGLHPREATGRNSLPSLISCLFEWSLVRPLAVRVGFHAGHALL